MTRSHPVRLCGKVVLATLLILGGIISHPWGGARVSAERAEISPVHEPLEEDIPAAATGNVAAERLALYDHVSILTGIPWYFLAAVDQYERNIAAVKKLPVTDRPISIYYTEAEWAGAANPNPQDTDIRTIALFGGIGLDGDGDGKADRNNDLDVLYTAAAGLLKHGVSREDFRIALWERYQNSRSVDRIWQFATIYHHFGTIELNQHAFPLPLGANYSYRSTWGDRRGWGGRRIHEGTDIFAGYGVPVRSTCYGIVEVKGWNPYGGWRIGIRDTNSVYHYFAHLSGFEKNLKVGDVVKPGQVIGWVGSSGYGKPGTSGKFPPHLHYGMYKDNGLTEWSFDPYPYLRKWEREERQRKKR